MLYDLSVIKNCPRHAWLGLALLTHPMSSELTCINIAKPPCFLTDVFINCIQIKDRIIMLCTWSNSNTVNYVKGCVN